MKHHCSLTPPPSQGNTSPWNNHTPAGRFWLYLPGCKNMMQLKRLEARSGIKKSKFESRQTVSNSCSNKQSCFWVKFMSPELDFFFSNNNRTQCQGSTFIFSGCPAYFEYFVSGDSPTLWIYLSKVEDWPLISFQWGPTDATEAPTNHQKSVKGLNLQENNGKSKASHGTYFDKGRDVRPRYTNSEAIGTRVQESIPARVTIGSCFILFQRSQAWTFPPFKTCC